MTTAPASGRTRLLTIGAVCERLKPEFPDISISKIRYLEGEGLVTPARTRGGYRLFGEEELARLETILRLQRDEFLPLKVIREELEKPTSPERRRRRARGLRDAEDELDQATLCKRAGIDRR
ncbi:MAG: MerR family transcriptional regulator, partial [Gaiellaceae bacterium]